MEDAHIARCEGLAGLEGAGDDGRGPWRDMAAFAVLDGHGGSQVADFVSQHFVEELVKTDPDEPSLEASLTSTFHTMDRLLASSAAQAELQKLTRSDDGRVRQAIAHRAGCTAVVALVTAQDVVVAHAGDSRAVVCRAGEALAMTEDHKPEQAGEEARIKKAGGTVHKCEFGMSVQYRVNGGLNVSRALGDLEYKRGRNLQPEQQMVCATPDVRRLARRADDEFLLLACDGIWDVCSNQEACDFISERLKKTASGEPRALTDILEELLDKCLSPDLDDTNGLGGDNMTALLVVFPGHGDDGASAAEDGRGEEGVGRRGQAQPRPQPSKAAAAAAPRLARSPTLEQLPPRATPSLLGRLAAVVCCQQT